MYSRSILRSIRHYKVNLIIKVLIMSDFLIWSSYQLFAPFFAIFVTDKINGGSIEVVGISAAIYLVVKSVFEVPVGMYIDRSKSEIDDLLVSILGTSLTAVAYFSYMFIDSVAQLYILQCVLGLAAAIAYPGWYSIFTHHIDKRKEAFEWSLYDVILGIGMAASAAAGGFLAEQYGFDLLFLIIGLFTVLGAVLLFRIKGKIRRR